MFLNEPLLTRLPALLHDPAAVQRKGLAVRDAEVDVGALSHLARWLVRHYRFGTDIRLERDDGSVALYPLQTLLPGKSGTDYWNEVAAEFIACSLFDRIVIGKARYTLCKAAPAVPAQPHRYAW